MAGDNGRNRAGTERQAAARTYDGSVNHTRQAGTKFLYLIAIVAFAFILIMPVSQGNLLLGVFGLMALGATSTIISTGRVLTPAVMAIMGMTFALGLYGLALGANNPGVGNAAVVFIAAPALFFLCVAALGAGSIRVLLSTCAIVTTMIGVYILAYVGGQLGIVPQVMPAGLLEITGAGFGAVGDATQIRFFGLSTLAAAAPMWLVSVFVKQDELLPPMAVRVMAAVAGAAGALVGGRRAIVLVLILIPLVAWIIKSLTSVRAGPRKMSPLVFVGSLAIAVTATVALPTILTTPILTNTWHAVVSFFNSAVSGDADQSTRWEQADRLMEAWHESPFTGQGLGSVIPDYARSASQPWQFEMQYQTLLMNVGLVGVAGAIALAAFVVRAIYLADKLRPDLNPTLIVTLCGGAAMLMANATNPYLQAPAHQWAIFLPLALVNFMLREGQEFPGLEPVSKSKISTSPVAREQR